MIHRYQNRSRRAVAGSIAAALAITGLVGLGTQPANADPGSKSAAARPGADTREAGPKVQKQTKVKLSKAEKKGFAEAAPEAQSPARSRAAADTATGTPVGGEKIWLGLDDTDSYFAASYVLKGVGTNIEVWVQSDLNYPEGDCRNDGVRNVVTDEQVASLITEFDTNILPKESEAFSVAPERDGTQSIDVGFGAPLWEILGDGDPTYYQGDGNKTVALISNVRDANFYDPTTPDGATYIAGFFSPLYNEAFDRNVMTIDSYDWLHRTGANPPNEEPGGLCSTQQAARPRSYEGTFAHEYQHLLEYYEDPGENTWLNEGLADYAQSLVGYVDTTIPYGTTGADGHISCFQGFAGTDSFPYCGAENSITQWEDQGSPSTLSDYGAAYAFVTYLADHFGQEAITFLHRDDANGLASLQSYLDDHAPGLTTMDVLHDFTAQMALDRLVDEGAKGLTKDQKGRFTSSDLSSAIDWAWTGSYDSPGGPPNGSDYVLAQAGRPVNGKTITSLSFDGAEGFAPDPLEWVVDQGALFGGTGDDLDRAAVYSVSVPAGSPALTFSTQYDIEEGWDFGIVQVSTDGGKTYTSLANENTTSEHAEGADGGIVEELPGLTGLSDGWTTQSYDLSPYAGSEILISFRFMTDAAVNGNGGEAPGWWIKDVKVGDTLVTAGDTTEGARSATEVSPIPVVGWNVQAVGWSLDGKAVTYTELTLDENNAVTLDQKALKAMFKKADRIGFIVTLDDPDEVATKNADYQLVVNGVLQPGGSGTGDPVAAKTHPVSKRLPG